MVLEPDDSLSSIRAEINHLLGAYEAESASHQKMRAELEDKLRQTERLRERLEAGRVMDILRRAMETVTEIRVLQLAVSLSELQSHKSVTDIPAIVGRCAADLMHFSDLKAQDTEIMKFCIAVTEGVRQQLLEQFLVHFEHHLNDEESESADEDWVQFVRVSKDWLLAYALVSLLPLCSKSTPESRVVDRYNEAVDEILLPLWGRYLFHLKHAREAQSQEQILWTFQYSIHFCHLVINMVKSILDSGQLKIILNANYQLASNSHVINKVTRFMRSHVAQVLVSCDQTDKDSFYENIVMLVEASLDFDHQLQLQEPTYIQDSSLSSIFVDTAVLRDIWVLRDCDYFKERMQMCSHEAFEFKFSSADSPFPRCFHGVYTSIVLLVAASQRYQYLPRLAIDKFSSAILEPLMLCGMGFLLYRVRHNRVLRSITEERFSEYANEQENLKPPAELEDLRVTADYFQQAMKSIPSKLCFGFGRLSRRWKALLPWIKSAAFADLPPKNLVVKVFDTSGSSMEGTMSDRGSLTDVQYSIEQVATMVNELERQWKSALR